MLKGINLTLMIGPAVPVPVSREVIEALTSVTVTIDSREQSGFQLDFTISNHSMLQTLFLLTSAVQIPFVRVLIIATVNGTTEVLMDGMMTHHQVTTDANTGRSTLTVMGKDLSVVMDYIDFSGIPYPAMPREARVALILAKYAVFGVIPLVIPSVMIDVPLPTERIYRHRGKDLAYVKRLAEEVGYVFYVDPGPAPGVSTAYWGPEIKVGAPQPALNINMDAHTNVETINFSIDKEKKKLPIVMIQEEITKAPIGIPIPDITPLNPPLGLIPPLTIGDKRITETARLKPLQGLLIGLAKAARYSEAVFATGTLDVLRYGRLLKARKLVGVRGAGPSFDGLYYVSGVTHKLKLGEYKQEFKLSRNGLVSTLQNVPV
jgi:hypothetical protein